ncbi:hypothetical protein SE17_01160 [Kouleothrix aurantiaca]|uniref:Uncharacterized protein n=1 Tax=Kouleothrix aurantiaca TaxID=186479 RepID=A0A0P9DY41_9CHLR|nr:hypothetical protein SE17_01160 [Kouleothrix aurantiaca]
MSDLEQLIYATDAEVIAYRAEGDVVAASDPELLALAKKQAIDPTIFDERAPYFWGAEISNTRLDSYFTHMSPRTTLKNFADDANAGVSFQNSHNYRELGFGRSVRGKFIGAQGNGVAKTTADFYTIPDLTLNGVNTNDLIHGMRAGIAKSVSVGFFGGAFICDLCGRDMLTDWSCPHIPGFRYDPSKPDDWHTDPNGVIATATVEDARLAEVSVVFKGATPGAAVQKAHSEAARGRMGDRQRMLLEQRYRIQLPPARVSAPGATFTKENEPMAPSAEQEATRAALTAAGVPESETDPIAAIRWLGEERQRLLPLQTKLATFEGQADELKTLRAQSAEFAQLAEIKHELEDLRPLAAEVRTLRPLKDEVARLAPLAKELEDSRAQIADGKQYRQDLIDEALAEGVRAYGADWKPEIYKPVLEAAGIPIATIRQMRNDWKQLGDKRYPAGTQTNTAASDEPAGDKSKPAATVGTVPNAVYAN